ncbi:MAG: thioredoxin [Methanobacteriota archaeon]
MDDPELQAIRARRLEALQAGASAASPDGRPIKLSDATFDAEVAKPGLVLVDFWAAWCGPCLRVAPVLDEIAEDMAGALRVGKLNVDENPRTSMRFGVMSIPTMLLFKDGKLVDGIVGAYPRPEIEAVIRKWT